MHQITATKLTALSTQRDGSEAEKKSILSAIANEQSQPQRIQLFPGWFLECKDTVGLAGLSASNVERFLDQSRHDSSVSPSLLQEWQVTFERALNIQSRKY